MYGDFSRDSFDRNKGYKRVLRQQGRPVTDSDDGEGAATIWDFLQEIGKAVFGWHGTHDDGFKVEGTKLRKGHYFVNGLLCFNPSDEVDLKHIPDQPGPLVVLDVWEQSVNAIEDPEILEPAMPSIDTSTRSRVCWAIRYTDEKWEPKPNEPDEKALKEFLKAIKERDTLPTLIARRVLPQGTISPQIVCESGDGSSVIRPWFDRLYRVEIHRQGTAEPLATGKVAPKSPTFKWSRENGSVVAAVLTARDGGLSGNSIPLDPQKFISRLPFQEGAFVELLDIQGRSVNQGQKLLKVVRVLADRLDIDGTVSPQEPDTRKTLADSFSHAQSTGYSLRQWNHSGTLADDKTGVKPRSRKKREEDAEEEYLPNAIISPEDQAAIVVADVWVELENGLEVCFSAGDYRASDYWLIRTTSDGRVFLVGGDRITGGGTQPINTHRYAPFGVISKEDPDSVTCDPKYRRCVDKRNKLCSEPNLSGATQKTAPLLTETERPPDSSSGRLDPLPQPSATPDEASQVISVRPASVLSTVGRKALRGLLASPKNMTRRVPARYLNYDPTSAAYRRFRTALMVSEIREPTFEQYLAKVLRTAQVDNTELPLLEADARADFELAANFEQLVSSGGGVRQMFA